jgi:hypothetical protein
LLKEDKKEIFKGYQDVEVQRSMIVNISKRYTEIFNDFSDGEAAWLFKKIAY